MEELRRAQIYKESKWSNIDFNDIKKGDIFRLFEPTGEPVTCEDVTVFYASSDPHLNSNNGMAIESITQEDFVEND